MGAEYAVVIKFFVRARHEDDAQAQGEQIKTLVHSATGIDAVVANAFIIPIGG